MVGREKKEKNKEEEIARAEYNGCWCKCETKKRGKKREKKQERKREKKNEGNYKKRRKRIKRRRRSRYKKKVEETTGGVRSSVDNSLRRGNSLSFWGRTILTRGGRRGWWRLRIKRKDRDKEVELKRRRERESEREKIARDCRIVLTAAE